MPDIPRSVRITEEGPREGFQIEPGPIPTARKIELINTLARTGLKHIQAVSFVHPKRVPGWADAEQVVDGLEPHAGVEYTGLWLNEKGLQRAVATGKLYVEGKINMYPSVAFLKRNQNCTPEEYRAEAGRFIATCKEMRIDTGIDLEALIAAAQLAEEIVGHPLPGSVMKGGSLQSLRPKPH